MSTSPEAAFQTRDRDGITIITPTAFQVGREEIQTLHALVAKVAEGPEPRCVVLDLGPLRLFRSDMIAALINARKTLHAVGGALKLCNAQPEVKRVLELTHVTDLLDLVPTEDDAVRDLRGSRSWLGRLFGKK